MPDTTTDAGTVTIPLTVLIRALAGLMEVIAVGERPTGLYGASEQARRMHAIAAEAITGIRTGFGIVVPSDHALRQQLAALDSATSLSE